MDHQVYVEKSIKSEEVKNTVAKLSASDTQLRKLARRLRIKHRVDASRNPKINPQEDEKNFEGNETLVENEKERSEEMLSKLLMEGQELVTNVLVANDAREVSRRAEELTARSKRRECLVHEAETSLKLFSDIGEGWDKIASNNDVIYLHDDIQLQKEKCKNLVENKNALIKTLTEELTQADLCYTNDLRKQMEDVTICAARIDSQVDAMRRAYISELSLLEMAINKEHEDLIQEFNKSWMELYVQREESADEHMKERFLRVAQQQKDLRDNQTDFSERYRLVKIALETDIQVLQLEVEQIKAVCLMNSEKLDYNYQVLKKREEESTILKSQQKRKITRLLDNTSKLKAKIAEIHHKTKVDSAKLTDEVVRMHKNIMEVEEKSDLFAEVNDRKYQELWQMNKRSVLALLEKVLDADRVICEQQLCMEWGRPEVINNLIAFPKPPEREQMRKFSMVPVDAIAYDAQKRRLLRHLLQRLVENSQFILEDRLSVILTSCSSQESMLVSVDGIFQALDVNTLQDIDILLEHFIPYLQCPLCDDMDDVTLKASVLESCLEFPELSNEEKRLRIKDRVKDEDKTLRFGSESLTYNELDEEIGIIPSEGIPQIDTEDGELKLQTTIAEDVGQRSIFTCSNSHSLLINPNHVLRAVKDFASNVHHSHFEQCKSTKTVKDVTSLRQMAKKTVEDHWSQFLDVFPKSKEKLWDALLGGLQKYYLILQDRHKLVQDTTKLRCQNTELRQLLQQYIISNAIGKEKLSKKT